MRKKIIAVLLACMMAASVVPMSVSADGDGAGSTTVVTQGTVRPVTDQDSLQAAINAASEGDTIKLQGDITLTSTLTIDKKVTIDGANGSGGQYTISVADAAGMWPTDNSNKYMLVVTSGATIQNVTIDAEKNASGCLQFYTATGGQISNVTLKNAKQLGLNVNASTVTATGTVTLSGNGWGDIINVGWGSGASNASGCSFNASGASLSGVEKVYTDTNDANQASGSTFSVQLPSGYTEASLTDEDNSAAYYASFEKAVQDAKSGATVTLNQDVTVSEPISITKPITIDGNGNTITGAFTNPSASSSESCILSFEQGSSGSILKDVTLVANDCTSHTLNVWQAGSISLEENVKLDHTNAMKGAPMVVVSSNVTVNGNLEMITGANSWYAFNVDSEAYKANAKVTFSKSSTVTYTDNSKKNLPLAGLDLMDDQLTDTAVSDPANKVLAARFVAADGQVQLFDNLQDAVTAAEANAETSGSKVTITVLRSNEEATFNYEGDVKFELAKGVESPVLTDEKSGTEYEVGTDGNVVPAEDTEEPDVEEPVEEIYTVTVDGKVWDEYEEGDTVSLYAPLYTYDGRRFVKWVVTSNNIVLENAYSNQITFKMPAGNVSVYPYYTYISYTPVEPDVPDYTPVKPVEPDEPEIEWIQKDGNTYLYIDDEMITGWYQDEETEKWYWFDEETGVMSDDCWEKIDGVWYLFDEDGIMLTGWQKVDGKWYYLKPWGGMATGWQLIDSVWYYLRGDGSMAANAWVQSGGYWYYLTGSGEMATACWIEWKGDWYYLYSSGIMATNATIDGCYIDSNGIWRA